jgi:hypothetical protein
VSVLELTGYRQAHAPLLEGAWIAGELLSFSSNEARSAVAIRSAGPADASTERLLVVPGVAFVRFAELELVHRRARLEIGVQGGFDPAKASALLALACETAFVHLNLHRVYGWVRPGHAPTSAVLALAGFEPEVSVPDALRVDGVLGRRELWGTLRDDQS